MTFLFLYWSKYIQFCDSIELIDLTCEINYDFYDLVDNYFSLIVIFNNLYDSINCLQFITYVKNRNKHLVSNKSSTNNKVINKMKLNKKRRNRHLMSHWLSYRSHGRWTHFLFGNTFLGLLCHTDYRSHGRWSSWELEMLKWTRAHGPVRPARSRPVRPEPKPKPTRPWV